MACIREFLRNKATFSTERGGEGDRVEKWERERGGRVGRGGGEGVGGFMGNIPTQYSIHCRPL